MARQRPRRCRVVVEEVEEIAAAAPEGASAASAPAASAPAPAEPAPAPTSSVPAPASAASAPGHASAASPPVVSARQAAIAAACEKRMAAQKRKAEWEASKNKKGTGSKKSKSAKPDDVLAKAVAEMVFPEDADPGLWKQLGMTSMGVGDGVLQSMQLPTLRTNTKPAKKRS